MSLAATLLTSLLLLAAVKAQSRVYIYAGIANSTNTPSKIYLYPDYLLTETIISSNDFNCTETNGCTIVGDLKEMTLFNKTLKYQEATMQINLIKQPFDEKVRFRYVPDDAQNITSMLGIAQNSTFLNYYNRQNKKNEYSLIFRMDYENRITFRDNVPEKKEMRPYSALNARMAYNFTDAKWAKGTANQSSLPVVAKLCLSNRVDMESEDTSVIAVKESTFATWAALVNDINADLNDQTDTLANNITFTLYDPQAQYIGQMVYYMDEFVDDNKKLLIKPFTPEFDEGRACDIYTGMRMLKKYNIFYYYVENATGYQVLFTYDLNNMNNGSTSTTSNGGFWWKLLLFIVIVGIIGYFVYRYFTGSRDSHDAGDDDTYRGFQNNQDMTELREIPRVETAPKKPVPAPTDDNEKIPPLLGKSY